MNRLVLVPRRRSALSLALILALSPLSSAYPSQSPQTPTPSRDVLAILVLEGKDAVNSIPAAKVTNPVIEVRDENNLPVEGAEVTFELPASGPGGTFTNQKQTATARTNLQGQATAAFTLRPTAGQFTITVRATAGDRTGKVSIRQTNSMRPPVEEGGKVSTGRRWYKNWKLWAIAGGAGAAAAIILATRGGSSSSSTSPSAPPVITITPGSPSVGGPR